VDLDMLRDLDRIDDLRWTPAEGERGYRRPLEIASEWQQAFARFGVVTGITPAEEVARRVNESLVRDRLLTALDAWLTLAPSPALQAALHTADPDPFRDALRAAVLMRSGLVVLALTSHPEALNQPGRFALGLLKFKPISARRQEQLLAAALARRPADFGVLMSFGARHPIGQVATAEERERWFRAAAAARPGNVVALINL